MKTTKPPLAHTIHYYEPILHRYAMQLVNDATVAAQLVQQVLEDQYEIDRLAPSEHLGGILETDLHNRCFYYIQSIIFDRSPLHIPLPKYARDLVSIKNQ